MIILLLKHFANDHFSYKKVTCGIFQNIKYYFLAFCRNKIAEYCKSSKESESVFHTKAAKGSRDLGRDLSPPGVHLTRDERLPDRRVAIKTKRRDRWAPSGLALVKQLRRRRRADDAKRHAGLCSPTPPGGGVDVGPSR